MPVPKLFLELYITIAEGVPIPDEKDLSRDAYLHREIGLVLYDKIKN